MPAALALAREAENDHCVYLHAVPWEEYLALDARRGESAVPRLHFFDGELELMTPSDYHELLKKKLARLVEAYADWTGLALEGFGSWTLRNEALRVGLEPDECYSLEPVTEAVPQLAIEVIWTSGGLDKLATYRRLGVPEVWIWRDDRLTIHVLGGEGYDPVPRSRLLPELDPGLLAEAMAEPTQTAAVRALRRRLESRA